MSSPDSLRTSLLALFSVLVLLSALWYKKQQDDAVQERLQHTLSSLLQVEKSFSVNAAARVAVGYGSCVDVVSSASVLLTSRWQPPQHLSHHDVIADEQQLLQSFAYFFARGAAAE